MMQPFDDGNLFSLEGMVDPAILQQRLFAPIFLSALQDRAIPVDGIRFLPLTLETDERSEEASLFFLHFGADLLLLADFTRLGENVVQKQESPDSLFERFLDLSYRERMTLWTLGAKHRPRWVLCATADGISLLDPLSERALVRGSAKATAEELDQILSRLENPDSSLPAHIGFEQSAIELRRWSDLFSGILGPALKWGRSDADRLTRQVLLGLKALLAEIHTSGEKGLDRLGVSLSRTNEGMFVQHRQISPADLLDFLLQASSQFVPEGAGAFTDLERRALVRQFSNMSPARQAMIHEVTRLSAVKSLAATQLRMLAPKEQEQISWRLALIEPLRIAEEIEASDLYVFRPMLLDLAECGYGRMLEAVEKLAFYALKQNAEIRRLGGRQMDLIEPEPAGLDGDFLGDPFNWLLRHALRIKAATTEREIAGYLVASFILDIRKQDILSDCRFQPLTYLPHLFSPED